MRGPSLWCETLVGVGEEVVDESMALFLSTLEPYGLTKSGMIGQFWVLVK